MPPPPPPPPPKDAAGQSSSGSGGDGRLNDLPDRVLVRVLCHLKAWEAVRACLLSKRWRVLWTFVPRLDIRQPCGCRGGASDQRWAEAFAEFVKHLLLGRRYFRTLDALGRCSFQPLDALRLCWSHPARDGDADTWIAHPVRHGAEEVELSGAHHADYPSPEYLSFLSGDSTVHTSLKIVKLIHVRLDDTTLTQLCSTCSSLKELELKDCSVENKEIHSTSLKCLNMISCKFVDGFRVYSPNLESLRCIRPFGYVPRIQGTGFLVTATFVLDDRCLCNDHRWSQEKDDKDESGHDGDYFAHAGSEDSDDNSFAHCDTEESGGNNHSDSDDNSYYYDSDWSGPSDDERDDLIVCYSEIADEYKKKPYKYLVNGNNRSAGGPIDDCAKNSNFGGSGMLCSLSNFKTMDLLAHPGMMVLTRELKSCPEFKKLKTLSLGEWCMTSQLDALATVLNHSPKLENLFLHLDLAFNSRVGINPQGSSFSCPNLKRVMITCCNRDGMVRKLAKFFRANGITNKKIFVRRTKAEEARKLRKSPTDVQVVDVAVMLMKMIRWASLLISHVTL